jgi:hypothetical protein
MMRYRRFTVGPPPHEAFFTMSDAIGQTLPDIQIINAIICVIWAVTGMALYVTKAVFSCDIGRLDDVIMNWHSLNKIRVSHQKI